MKVISEIARLQEARSGKAPWKKWGPYLSERQWGTVREDYSSHGNAWDYFSHDQARSRAYHWGEDGLAGISSEKQLTCFGLALWNGRDPILKERLFGLTNNEGNHGEDVKEYYFYLDSTPTHSYMKYLYKYPQAAFPYDDLVATNKRRGRGDMEYELLDTGVFNEDRYFDVFMDYAKQAPSDILIQITVCNRGSQPSVLHVLPTVWFRNIWNWSPATVKPLLKQVADKNGPVVSATHTESGQLYVYFEGNVPLLFVENETNNERLFGTPNVSSYVKDGINSYVVHGKQDAVNPVHEGTKAAAHYQVNVRPSETTTLRLRITDLTPARIGDPFEDFSQIMQTRRREADEFYKAIIPERATEDEARIMRQALAGMLWTKQYFAFDVDKWLEEHGVNSMVPGTAKAIRNREWFHMINDNVISMPDKWEYPWYAAWDLAFHAIALTTVDIDFAKEQLELLLSELFLHPTGQIPAYEWNFSDVNPPVHAWATIFLYRTQQALHGEGDIEFLRRSFDKLALNFSWWVNRKDRFGNNLFGGGFLGLDNIGVFDRSAPLPTGGYLEQADGTAWVAMFCQNMAEIAVELTASNPSYEAMAAKYIDQWLLIAGALNHTGPDGMWDEQDGFYYDVLPLPDGRATRLKVRSLVGLLPLCATLVIESWQRERVPRVTMLFSERLRRRPRTFDKHPRHGARPSGGGEARHLCLPERGQTSPNPVANARREQIFESVWYSGLVPLPRRSSLRRQCAGAGISGELSSGRIGLGHVRRKLQLARADLDAS